MQQIIGPKRLFLLSILLSLVARNLEEAILWHGGEAGAAKTAFTQLPVSDREALIRFLKSL